MLGLYDSGIGGLTILNQIQKKLPGIEIAYLADTKNCPLGEKTASEIMDITIKGVEYLFKKGCNLVILACNTATVTSIRELQNQWLPKYYPDKKVLGIVRPVPEFLIENTIHNNINLLVLATPATVESGFYKQELHDFQYHNVTEIPCPSLAATIEQQDPQVIKQTITNIFREYQVSDMKINFADFNVILMACTHYPLAVNLIKETFIEFGGNSDVLIFDQTQLVTDKLLEYLGKHPEITIDKGKTTIYVNGDERQFGLKTKKLFISLDYQILPI